MFGSPIRPMEAFSLRKTARPLPATAVLHGRFFDKWRMNGGVKNPNNWKTPPQTPSAGVAAIETNKDPRILGSSR